MTLQENDTFVLENFEGPLDFLLHLIQKNELHIYDIPIQELVRQFLDRIEQALEPTMEKSAEFIGTTASLMWLKSRMLLPKHPGDSDEIDESDPRFEIIHLLLDYCRFKEAAKDLTIREQRQTVYYPRGEEPIPEVKKGIGVEHLSLQDLETLFLKILQKSDSRKVGQIEEEAFRISDKLSRIRALFRSCRKASFKELFQKEAPKGELIVTFLAILELLKLGEAALVRDHTTSEVMLLPKDCHESA